MKEWQEILELVNERDSIDSQIGSLESIICGKVHPYKIGDKITIKGYSHNGKQCRVTTTWFTHDHGIPKIGVRGIVLKKDGKDSEYTCGWNHWHDELLSFAIEGFNEER